MKGRLSAEGGALSTAVEDLEGLAIGIRMRLFEMVPKTVDDWEKVWEVVFKLEDRLSFVKKALDAVAPISWRSVEPRARQEKPRGTDPPGPSLV